MSSQTSNPYAHDGVILIRFNSFRLQTSWLIGAFFISCVLRFDSSHCESLNVFHLYHDDWYKRRNMALASCKRTKSTCTKYRPWWQISWFSFSDHAFLSHHCRKPFLHLKSQYVTLHKLQITRIYSLVTRVHVFLWLLGFFSRNFESHRWISLTTIVFFFFFKDFWITWVDFFDF